MFPEVKIGSLSLHRATREQVVDVVFSSLGRGRGGTIVTANLDFLQRAAEDPVLADLYGQASLRVADGMPVLWLAQLAGEGFPERVAGSDLVWALAERAAREGRRLFLLGGGPGAAEAAEHALRARYPSLLIVGTSSPRVSAPPRPEELSAIRLEISAARADLVYCAFGTPKQEQVAASLALSLPEVWWLGCGISLSFIAGHVSRAPRWVQRLGFEWLHRMAQEPGRLAHRYLIRNLPFLLREAARQIKAHRGAA